MSERPAASDGGGDSAANRQLQAHLIALLFAADEPLSISELARILDVRRPELERALAQLIEAPPPGLLIQRHEDRLQLATAPASARYIRRLRGLEDEARLSRAALEVLAVIAYRQPVTRAEIEAIRGVNGDRALSTLLTRGLVAEVGRRDTVGRPVLFGTTLDFLEHLGLTSLSDLPQLPEATMASAEPAPHPYSDEAALSPAPPLPLAGEGAGGGGRSDTATHSRLPLQYPE